MNINYNIINLRQKLPADCKLIAVSKTQPLSKIQEAYEGGQRRFGENKVQELVAKYEALPKDIEWHMIGHLQSNKVKYIAPFASLIHGVDSPKLLTEINRQAKKTGRKISCLLQVFIAEEETKFGFSEKEIMELLEDGSITQLTDIRVVGLMGMATFTPDKNKVRSEFRKLKTFFDNLSRMSLPQNFQMSELSIGMSSDYEIGVEEGSTMVRIGTAIFGERNLETTS